MPLLWSVALGAAVGWGRFGSPAYLRRLRWRAGWLFLAAVAVQQVSMRAMAPGEPGTLDARGLLFLLGYVGVLAGVIANRHLWAVRVIGLGFALNLVAVLPHGGYMPITAAAYAASGQARPTDDLAAGARLRRAKDVVLPSEQTQFWPLTDVFPVRDPAWLQGVYSPGDLIVALGALMLAAGAGLTRGCHDQRRPDPWAGGADEARLT